MGSATEDVRKTEPAGVMAAFALPHPPLIVPGVGRGQERGIQPTIDAYEEVARRVEVLAPDTLVVTSPHDPLYRDGFHLGAAERYEGSMAQFRAPGERLEVRGAPRLAEALAREAAGEGLPVGLDPRPEAELDHGSFVPLHFMKGLLGAVEMVVVGLSGLSPAAHRQLGACITRTLRKAGRQGVLLASGDLSHKLKEDGPYGFAPEGPQLDAAICAAFEEHRLDGLFRFDEALCEAAAECGLRSFQIMVGAVEEENRLRGCAPEAGTSELLSYVGPFGVGYAVAEVLPGEGDARGGEGVGAAASEAAGETTAPGGPSDAVDPYVALARAAVEAYVAEGRVIAVPEGLPRELTDRAAGAFVSLHEGPDLRGCIGTIAPTTACVAAEVIQNGISAATRDPRFAPVVPEELDLLSYSVDVLAPPEPIGGPEALDPSRYGVIVTKDGRRGLLLPNLDGVDSVAEQLAIAKRKGGIDPADADVQLERFEVVRHDRGGQARWEG